MRSVALLILLLFFFSHHTKGQAQLYGVNDGLSNKDITAIIQGKTGCMWIGTSNGVNQYDGYTFREYNRHNGLSNGRVKCLYEDEDGYIWIGTWEGLSILNPATGEVTKYFQARVDNDGRILSSQVGCIVKHADGSVLVTLGDGLLMRFSDREHYTQVFELHARDNTYAYTIFVIACLPDSSVCFVSNYSGITKLDKDFIEDKNFNTGLRDAVSVFCPARSKNPHFVNNRGIVFETDQHSGKVIREIPEARFRPDGRVFCAFTTTDGKELWLSYSDGSIEKLELQSGIRTDFTDEIRNALTGASVVIYRDRKGLAWVGTDYGLIKFFPKHHFFTNYIVPTGSEYKNRNSIRGIAEDRNGDIYAGGYNGLFRFNPATGEQKHFDFPELGNASTHAYYPFRLCIDSNYIWITSETRGFYRFNKKTSNIEFFADKFMGGSSGFYKAIAMVEDGKDTLWLGTHNGLFVYRRSTGSLVKYKGKNDLLDMHKVEISDLAKGSDGRIYIGGYTSGAFILDKARGITKRFSVADNTLPHNFVTVIYPENDSIIWVGSRGGGLARVNIKAGHTTVYLKDDGLADNSIAGIEKDKSGTIWISTFNGLSKYNASTNTFENYYEKDGLSDNEFNIAAHMLSANGTLYFGGVNGINAFEPGKLRKSTESKPSIYLTRFSKYDGTKERLVERTAVGESEELRIEPGDKFFSFSFALDDYYNAAHNVFSYKLEGFDNDWNNIGTQNTIRFNSLPQGSYVLRVRGTSAEGTVSENELVIHLAVSVAFYKTWWFFALALLLIILTVYLVTRYNIYQKIKIQRLRTKISSDLHDEVGSLLTRISIQAELLKQDMKGQGSVTEIDAIANASRMATAAMSDVLWSIDARNDNMGNLADKVRELAGEILYPLEIDVSFTFTNIDEGREIDNKVRQELFLILKEAINNIARHSNATKVEIILQNSGTRFIMKISDNGTIQQNELRQAGQGLKNMRMRGENLNGVLEITRKNGFTITLNMERF